MVAPLDIPRLTANDRFVLRSWEISDLPLVREASSDDHIPLITTVPAVYSREAGEAFVRRQWERVSTGSGYPFVIVRVEDGRPLGSVGLWLRDLDESPRRVRRLTGVTAQRCAGLVVDCSRPPPSRLVGCHRIAGRGGGG